MLEHVMTTATVTMMMVTTMAMMLVTIASERAQSFRELSLGSIDDWMNHGWLDGMSCWLE